MNTQSLAPSAQKVAAAAAALGLPIEIVTFSDSTRTAEEAAAAIGCEVGQIVKSLVFKTGDTPIIALVSGANQLDTRKLANLLGVSRKQVSRADADMVRTATGYAIGGVPPFGYVTDLTPFIDQDLTQYDQIWAATGTPYAVFAVAPDDLVRVTSGKVADLRAE